MNGEQVISRLEADAENIVREIRRIAHGIVGQMNI